MEYAIAIFVGVWISVAGILAYYRIKKDFADLDSTDNNGKDGDKR